MAVSFGKASACSKATRSPLQARRQPRVQPLNAGAKPPVTVVFVDEKKSAVATPGEVLADVAERAGVDIQLGCNQGNCGVCEVELERFGPAPSSQATASSSSSGGTATAAEAAPLVGSGKQVVRACVARVPGGGYPRVEISQMSDQIWGVDGFDT